MLDEGIKYYLLWPGQKELAIPIPRFQLCTDTKYARSLQEIYLFGKGRILVNRKTRFSVN
ncbi:hypothetical protein AtNW77_Chr3g0199571 [Arabidopsis thaliana]